MRIRKLKITALLLILTILGACAYPAYADEGGATAETLVTDRVTDNCLALLGELNIMNGDENGDLALDRNVSRAEFTKMAVAASTYRNSVASNLAISPFSDVPYTYWGAPYIRVGVTNELVSGYPDALFRPENTVTYEEAITIMLRVLGYTDDDFGVSWPSGQIGMADNLDMTDGLTCGVGEPMNRYNVARLVYNTLNTNMSDGTQKLINDFDVSIVENVTLISTSRDDSSIPAGEVFTDAQSYKIDDDFNYENIGLTGDAAIKDGDKLIAFMPDDGDYREEEYVVYTVLNDLVVVYDNGSLTNLDISAATLVYDGQTATTYSAIKSGMELGDTLKVRYDGDDISYVRYSEGELTGPITVSSENWYQSLGVGDYTSVNRDGERVAISDIQINDIVYVVDSLNMVMAYSNKVTGVYENASPNKDNPTSVTVSGTEYGIESSAAFDKLSSRGDIKIGDTVTLLLGRNNEVADVLTGSSSTAAETDVVGLLVETGTKSYTSSTLGEYTDNYITVVLADGSEREYISRTSYSGFKNSVVRVSIEDGYASVSRVRSDSISGTFDYDERTLGNNRLASDIKILDTGTTNSNDSSVYTSVYLQRLDGVRISSSKVLYYTTNMYNEIDTLFLYDVTGDMYTYGIMRSLTQTSMGVSVTGSYEYIVNGTTYNYQMSSINGSLAAGIGIKLSPSASTPDSLQALTRLEGNIDVNSSSYLTVGNKNYAIADDVQVYVRQYLSDGSAYNMLPISDIVGNDEYSYTAYYDKLPENGGRIRIIIANKY